MTSRLVQRAACMLLLCAPAFAQDATFHFENFEAGLPPTWTGGGPGIDWRLLQNGECGAVSKMMAVQSGAPACTYAAGSPISTRTLASAPMANSDFGGPQSTLSFDYILDIDAVGDSVSVYVYSLMGLVVLADNASLENDGTLHSIVLAFPPLSLNGETRIYFTFASDGVGDLGRGWMIDNFRTAKAGTELYCGSSASVCPCANGFTSNSRGCANSVSNGGVLRGIGRPSVSADTFRLGVGNVPAGSPTLFFAGTTTAAPTPFGDGVLCVGGTFTRLAIKFSDGGVSTYPEVLETPIPALTTIVPGSIIGPIFTGVPQYYQAMYRDPSGPCGFAFNLTNAWMTKWLN